MSSGPTPTPEQRREMLRKLLERKAQKARIYPVSLGQEALWFIDRLDPGRPTYGFYPALRLRGPLDVAVLERSIGQVLRRHDILRSTFPEVDDVPVQRVAPFVPCRLPITDLSGLPEAEREAELRRITGERPPLDLQKGPIIRFGLLRLGAEDHCLLVHIHHIVFDGWSLTVLGRELLALYPAFLAGHPSPLLAPPIQYADFAVWQRRLMQSDELERLRSHWRQRLAGLPPLDLATDYPRPSVRTSHGDTLHVTFSEELSRAVLDFSRRERVTSFMTLLAAFEELLRRYSGQEDFAVGTPTANRRQKSVEPLIGYFINVLVLRADLHGDPSFRELVQRVRATSLEAFEHQDLTLDKITEAVQPERDLSRHPLFQVMFVLQNMPRPSLNLPGIEVTPVGTIEHTRSAKFELTMPLMMTSEGLFEGDFNFNTDLFSPETARRMVAHYQMVLQDALANPDRPLSELPLLSESERRTVTRDWNAASAELPEVVGVEGLFAAHAARAPQAEAVVDRGRRWTYGELDTEANRLARWLQARGVAPEATVGICLERSAEFVLAVLAVLKAGGAYVPLDPTYSRDAGERLRFMVEDAGVSVIVTDAAHAAACPPSAARVLLDRDAEAIASGSSDAVASAATGESLAYVVYTSGSTGRPKGVMVTRENLLNAYVGWEQSYGLGGAAATHLQMASAGFDVFSGDLARALGSGGRLVLCPRDVLLSAPELLALIREERVEVAEFVPIVLRNLVEHLEESEQRLDGLRVVVVGSDAWYVEDHRRTLAVIGPETRLVNSYGLTEATIDSSFFEGDVHALPETGIVPIGRPFANVRLYVLDPHGRPVPVGVPGELFIGGRGVARGYVNRPDLEAERFVADPFAPDLGSRLCRTGDRVRWRDDGQIEFLGRVDQQVKIRGFRIEPGEVEEVLREHALLANAAVVALERTPGDMHLVAYVAGCDGVPPAVADLRRFLAGRLPDYMVPSAFVVLDALPTTASGKIDRRALPAPDWRHLADAAKGRPPQTETERMLAAVWADVLGVDRVGAEDNFFELGGNSLLAVRVVARLRSDASLNLPLAVLFTSPTLEGLAARIDEFLAAGLASHLPPIPVAPREAPIPLSFAQERFWFVHQLAAGTPILNMHTVLPVSGDLDLAAFRETVRDVVQRHESLRTTFVETSDGQAVQVISPSVEIEVPLEDVSDLPEREREELVSNRSREQAAEPFELGTGPLFRLRLLRCAEKEHVLLVTTTHLIFDGWSLQVLVGEVAEIYDARHAGEAAILPQLPVQYADYAVWQRQYLQGETMEALLEFWRATLADLSVLPLPTDRPRRVGAQGEKRWHPFRVSRALAARISRLCSGEGATTYMLTLATFQLLLHRLCSADDIPVATPVANRRQAETHGMIGLFVNTVIMRGDLSGNPTFRELLARVRGMALEAFAHQELPFERLVGDLQPERDVTRHPLAQVLFNFLQRHASGRVATRHELSVSPREGAGEEVPGLFDLTLSLAEEEHELRAALQYDTRLFDAATAERMAGQFVALLEQVVSHPDWELSRFDLLRDDERRTLVEDWNRTEAEFPEELCAHELFEAQVRRTPEAVAAVCGNRQMVYRELNEAANRLAHRLRRLGVRPDEIVAMWVERSLDVPTAVLGILKSGAAFLPLDPELPAERVQYMLRDAGVRFLVIRAGGDPDWRRDLAAVAPVPVVEAGGGEGDSLDPAPIAAPTNLAYAIYTSGSTGRPKGVAVEHRSLVNVVTSFCRSYELGVSDRVLHNTSISFDVAINEILPAVSSGAAVVVSDLPDRRDLLGLAQLVRDRAVTILAAAPTALARLNDLPDPLPGVRLVLSGGEALSLSDVDRLRQQAIVVNGYGPTETTICATCYVLPAEGVATDETLPIGRPLANYKAYILDQRLQCVPVGCPGELCLGGVGLARGYLNDAELTAAKFVPNPFVPGERVYRTGDRARWRPDGTIEFLGRLDRQVKIRGYRIELGEVEASLLAQPLVREAAVVDWQVAPGDTRLVAYVVLASEDAGTEEVRSSLAEQLPEYMVPAAFVPLEALPLASTGKVDRRALPEPDFSHDTGAGEYVAPRTPLEEKLCALWAETLKVERVGVHDDFFALGGHSLLAVRLVGAMNAALGERISLADMFRGCTVASLAERLADANAEALGCPLALPGETGGEAFALANVPGRRALVCLAEGGGAPLFIAPGIGGLVFGLLPLAASFDGERSVYAFQALGLTGDHAPQETYDDMAALFIEEMRSVQPRGPYRLAGWCVGGLVAIEMARQLRTAGEEVLPVAMLDTFLYEPTFMDRFLKEAGIIRWLAPVLNIPEKELVPLAIAGKWEELAEKLGLPPDSGPEQVRRLSDVCRAHLRAGKSYKATPYSEPVVLQVVRSRFSPGRKWRRLFPQLSIHEVDGAHYTMLREPHVASVVDGLRRHLDMPPALAEGTRQDAVLP